MAEVKIADAVLQAAAKEGMDQFITVVHEAIAQHVGGELNADSMQQLNTQQITLWGYMLLREEVMDGGFVQLIHNGYGPFFFDNPFAKILRDWGLRDLAKLMFNAQNAYRKHRDELTQPCTDEEFMALFERFPIFDDLDDEFVENEEEYTAMIAHYVDENIHSFIHIEM